jgi:hypothetical protein
MSMRKTILILVAAAAGLVGGCASQHHMGSASESRTPGGSVPGVGYDDRQIARIQRGETGEAQLLEWFGPPESRELKPDGRVQMSWSFSRKMDGGRGQSGALSVSLSPDGKVDAYSARAGLPGEKRPVEFMKKYDDHQVAQIRRGTTTEAQLVEWFGPACSRNLQPDGRSQLAWSFASLINGGEGHSGELKASLAPDGKVDAYSARRGPQ